MKNYFWNTPPRFTNFAFKDELADQVRLHQFCVHLMRHVYPVGVIRAKASATTCLANCSISLSKMVFLVVSYQGFYLSYTLSWKRTESQQSSKHVGGCHRRGQHEFRGSGGEVVVDEKLWMANNTHQFYFPSHRQRVKLLPIIEVSVKCFLTVDDPNNSYGILERMVIDRKLEELIWTIKWRETGEFEKNGSVP